MNQNEHRKLVRRTAGLVGAAAVLLREAERKGMPSSEAASIKTDLALARVQLRIAALRDKLGR